MNDFIITMAGTRGSVPCSGENFLIYGGSTTCVRVMCGETEIFLDAGSGIIGAPVTDAATPTAILFTHLHLDHIFGLPFYGGLFLKNKPVTLYGKDRGQKNIQQTLDDLFTPPYWPVGLMDFPANVTFSPYMDHFAIHDVVVTAMEGAHPGGSTVYRLEYEGRSMVFATDFEHNDIIEPELVGFAKDTDLLIYDAQYTDEEYPSHRGFGHSTPEIGIRIATAAKVKHLLFTHHSPDHDDSVLSGLEEKISSACPFASYAKANQIIHL